MSERMKVHAFGVSPHDDTLPLETLLGEIRVCPLSERVRSVGTVEYRIDSIENRDDGLWYIDFGKFRTGQGPGAASRETPVRGFEFEENEVFCEETAFLYDPETAHSIIQYNHHGARVSAIQEYFNSFAERGVYTYEFRPKYDADAEGRFNNRAEMRKLTFAIDPRFLSNKDREKGTALAQAIEMGNNSNGTKLEVTISVGYERTRYLSDYASNLAEALKRLFETNPDSVPKLEVGVLPTLDSKMEMVDLIAQRLSITLEDLQLGPDLRIPVNDRFIALKRAYNGWIRLF